MSRVGKLPILLPSGVTAAMKDTALSVKGPKGELSLPLNPRVQVGLEASQITVAVKNPDEKRDRALWGLFRVLVSNLVEGVTKGFEKKLEIKGVGYKADVGGKNLNLSLGYSHPIAFPIPEGISMTVDKNIISVIGIDKQLVGETAAKIRRLRLPEPYKGKGVRYVGEYVRQKAGKVVKAAGAK